MFGENHIIRPGEELRLGTGLNVDAGQLSVDLSAIDFELRELIREEIRAHVRRVAQATASNYDPGYTSI